MPRSLVAAPGNPPHADAGFSYSLRWE